MSLSYHEPALKETGSGPLYPHEKYLEACRKKDIKLLVDEIFPKIGIRPMKDFEGKRQFYVKVKVKFDEELHAFVLEEKDRQLVSKKIKQREVPLFQKDLESFMRSMIYACDP